MEVAQAVEDVLEGVVSGEMQELLVLVQEELQEWTEHGADLVGQLKELLRGVLVRLCRLGIAQEVLEQALLWVL